MTNEPMNEPTMDVTSDDKLWAALGYAIPLIALIVLFMEDKKARPFIKFHAVQSLAGWVVYTIASIILGITVVGAICAPFLYFIFLYWAYKAYQGEMFEIPVVTNFIKGQGWA
jgi:uncharacterized membrane protein